MKTRINTFLVGVQKGGTSSLYDWLGQHPDIEAPNALKDFLYFSAYTGLNKKTEFFHSHYNNNATTKIRLQGAVNYFYFDDCAEKLKEYNPEAKIILVLRNPIDRAISAHSYFTKLGVETLSLINALDRENRNEKFNAQEMADFTYQRHGLYAEQLNRYLVHFEKSQIKILLYEDLMSNKEVVIKDVFQFLGIESSFVPKFVHKNKTGQARFIWLNRLLFGKKGLGKLVSLIGNIFPLAWKIQFGKFMRESNIKSGKAKGELYDRSKLEPYYEKDMEDLSKLLDIDMFDKWDIKKNYA